MPSIQIRYCVPCGLLDQAIETQRAILEEHGRDIDAVALEPGHGGVFVVSVDGEAVFDKDDHDTGYDLPAIEDAVRAAVGSPA